jgi:outer membrane protein
MSRWWRPVRWVLSAATLCGVVACQEELFKDSFTASGASAERLHQMGTFEPLRETTETPQGVEEAVAAMSVDRMGGAAPPPRLAMSLAECRASALRRNLDLRVQLFSPSIAQANVGVEMAKFESSVFVNYDRNDQNIVTNLLSGEGAAQDVGEIGVNVPLVTGGNLSVAAESLMANQDLINDGVLPGTQDAQGGLQFSISQPLLRGAGIEANTASIRVAKLNSQIADARTKLEAIRVLANVDRAYWNLYAATAELTVRQQQYELAVAQLELARRQVRAGQVAEVEVIRAESGVGRTIENIILADNAVRLRQRDLKRILNDPNLPIEGGTYVEATTPPSPVSLRFDPETMCAKASDNRMEMLELELQLSIDATNIDLARNQALPLFSVDYTYQYFGYGTNVGNAWSSLGDADQYALGAGASIQLGNEAAKNRIQAAILTRLQRLATRDARRLSIRQEVLNAMDNLENAWRRILAARMETALAGRTYEAEKRQFDVGLRTSIEVLDAATRLGDAQSREVRALASWQISLVDLAFATGTQLGQARIDWSEVLPAPSARDAVAGLGGLGVNVGGEEGNQPLSVSADPATESQLKALGMPQTGPPVEPSVGLGVRPSDKPMGPDRAPPAPDLGVKPAPPVTPSPRTAPIPESRPPSGPATSPQVPPAETPAAPPAAPASAPPASPRPEPAPSGG